MKRNVFLAAPRRMAWRALLLAGTSLAAAAARADDGPGPIGPPVFPAQYWDGFVTSPTGVPGGEGGDGYWRPVSSSPGAVANFTTADGTANSAWQGSDAVFAGAAGTVWVDGAVGFVSARFMVTGYDLAPPEMTQAALLLAPDHSTVTTDPGVSATIGVSIEGPGRALVKEGAGTLILDDSYGATNTQSATIVNGGVLQITSGAMLGQDAGSGLSVAINNGATLAYHNAYLDYPPLADGRSTSFAGDVILGEGGGVIRVDDASNRPGDPDAATLNLQGGLSGPGGLAKTGTGTLALYGVSTYAGATDVRAGALDLFAAGALGAGDLTIAAGAMVRAYVGDASVATLNGGGVFSFASGGAQSLTVGGGAFSGRIGEINGATGALVKTGAETLTLSGANSYAGGTRVTGGTLALANAQAAGSGAIALADATALRFAASGMVVANAVTLTGTARLDSGDGGATLSGPITGAGGFTKTGAGTLSLVGANSYSGVTTISSGVLQIGTGGVAGSLGSGAVVNNASLLFNRSDAVTAAQTIGGTGALTQAGAGTLTLTGANSYAGGTFVQAGALAVGNAQALGSGALHLADATALRFLSSMTLSNAIVFSGAGDPDIDTAASHVTLSGAISGSGALTKLGTGTLVLTGANSYTGETRVAQGALEVNGSIASSTIVENGGALAGVGTVGAVAVASGGALAPGDSAQPFGTLRASGDVAFSSGARYIVSFGPAGASLLTTTGAASLNGAVAANWTGGDAVAGSRYTILTARNGVSGAFSSLTVTGLTTNLPVLAYDANDAYLVFNGLTRDAVTSSFDRLAGDRIGALVTHGVLAGLLDGLTEQMDCDSCVTAFGSAGALSVGAHGRLKLSENFALLGGAAFARYHNGGVEVTGSPIFLAALRYDKTDWGDSRPFAEIGGSASPWRRASFKRSYDDAGVGRIGTGVADAATYSVFGKLGWIYRWSPSDEAALFGGLSRSWQFVSGYVEGGAGNASPATIAAGVDRLDVARIGGHWTHVFGGAIETEVSLAGAQSLDARSGLSGGVLGLSGVRGALGDYRWAEYGLRLGYRFADNASVNLFADGTLGARPVGDAIYGGAGLRLAF